MTILHPDLRFPASGTLRLNVLFISRPVCGILLLNCELAKTGIKIHSSCHSKNVYFGFTRKIAYHREGHTMYCPELHRINNLCLNLCLKHASSFGLIYQDL